MCSDIELFINLIYMTDIMVNLQDENFNNYLECIKLTQDWEKFNNVQDIIDLNNQYINKAIKEILEKQKFLDKLKENTNIDIETLKQLQ